MTPRTTAPGTTAPGTTAPGTTAPGTTGPAGTALAATSPEALLAMLRTRLHPAARTWLDRALADATAAPRDHGPLPAWEARLAEAGRRCGPLHADATRVLLLRAAHADTDTLTRVYRQGTADERRAVLYALPALVPGPDALPLVEDALRTNDTRLLAAAVGPYATRHLDAHAWRHALLKCLFTGVPVDTASEPARRAHGDTELARMLRDFAAERTAAGRPVPDDLHRLLSLTGAPASPHPSDDPHGKES
ncbi:EboA domain-containing protein [Streptomyces sp. NPDC002308]